MVSMVVGRMEEKKPQQHWQESLLRSIFKKTNKIEIWGSGKQIRSFLYIDDCLKGTDLLLRANTDIQ